MNLLALERKGRHLLLWAELCFQKRYVQVLTHPFHEDDVNVIKVRPFWIRLGTSPVQLMSLQEERNLDTKTHERGEDHMTMEAEIVVLQPRASENCWKITSNWKSKEGFSPQASKGMWPCQHLDFRYLVSRNGTIHVCGAWFQQPQETKTPSNVSKCVGAPSNPRATHYL